MLESIDTTVLMRQIASGNVPQIYGVTKYLDYPDPQKVLSLQFTSGSPFNAGAVDMPVVNTVLSQADQNLDSTSRAQEYNQTEQLLVTTGAAIPLSQQKLSYSLLDTVQNFQPTPLGTLSLFTWQQLNFSA